MAATVLCGPTAHGSTAEQRSRCPPAWHPPCQRWCGNQPLPRHPGQPRRPPMGAEATAAQTVQHPRNTRVHRQACAAAPVGPGAVGHPGLRRYPQPAGTNRRRLSNTSLPRQLRTITGRGTRAPPARQSGTLLHPDATVNAQQLPNAHDHDRYRPAERLRLGQNVLFWEYVRFLDEFDHGLDRRSLTA